ncbi:hypothetical protein [uncultured Brachyspira sp.]|uniref:hypothetical protein n=1 Tax=uncultured Brachyspira sp. TaxID=221953 RepID=UPI0025EA76D3|nr:hypothetical protein [uncultured Brachyspira sp.]
MKILSIILILQFLLITSCTKDYGVKITKPGADLILSKMQSGNWANASANGNKLNISGSQNFNGDYTFEEPILGIGGVYKDDKGEYIMAAPAGNELYVVKMDKDAKKAVDAILDVIDDKGGEAVIGNLISAVMENGADIDLSDPNKILAGTNLPAEKRTEIENILKNSSGKFTNGEAIK